MIPPLWRDNDMLLHNPALPDDADASTHTDVRSSVYSFQRNRLTRNFDLFEISFYAELNGPNRNVWGVNYTRL